MNTANYDIIDRTKYENDPAQFAPAEVVTQEVSAPMCSKSNPNSTSESIPYGYCHCGCGEKTTVPKASNSHWNRKKGVPLDFVHGHNRKGQRSVVLDPPNPTGLCMCGCGEPTQIATKTDRSVPMLRGYPKRYILGHAARLSPHEYLEKDCGFTTPCWVWQRSTRRGYGVTEGQAAHRVYYERHKGDIPEGMHLDHLCRNRACVNPDHLEPVTPEVNSQRGLAAKLTPEDIPRILNMSKTLSAREIGRQLGVDHKTVGSVLRGKSWRNRGGAR